MDMTILGMGWLVLISVNMEDRFRVRLYTPDV